MSKLIKVKHTPENRRLYGVKDSEDMCVSMCALHPLKCKPGERCSDNPQHELYGANALCDASIFYVTEEQFKEAQDKKEKAMMRAAQLRDESLRQLEAERTAKEVAAKERQLAQAKAREESRKASTREIFRRMRFNAATQFMCSNVDLSVKQAMTLADEIMIANWERPLPFEEESEA